MNREIHTRQMPISDDFDMAWVMDNTYGFVGADLGALVREAAMKALRRYLPEIDLEAETIPPEVLEKMEVNMEDFKEAIRIEPSALREIHVEIPEVSWNEVGGLDEVKDRLKESVERPLTQPVSSSTLASAAPRHRPRRPWHRQDAACEGHRQRGASQFHQHQGTRAHLQVGWVNLERAIREVFKKATVGAFHRLPR